MKAHQVEKNVTPPSGAWKIRPVHGKFRPVENGLKALHGCTDLRLVYGNIFNLL